MMVWDFREGDIIMFVLNDRLHIGMLVDSKVIGAGDTMYGIMTPDRGKINWWDTSTIFVEEHYEGRRWGNGL